MRWRQRRNGVQRAADVRTDKARLYALGVLGIAVISMLGHGRRVKVLSPRMPCQGSQPSNAMSNGRTVLAQLHMHMYMRMRMYVCMCMCMCMRMCIGTVCAQPDDR